MTAADNVLKKVSFIIPNWNHKELLDECLMSVENSEGEFEREVIVVDNGSTDKSADLVRQKYKYVNIVENKQNEGYAKAVNKGITLSTGDYVFLLNNDVRLYKDTTVKLIEFLETRQDAGASCPLLYYPETGAEMTKGALQISCRRFPTPAALILEGLNIKKAGPFRSWKMTEEEHLNSGAVLQPMAAVLLIKRECLLAVGLMDERFPIFFNDVDWCYRLYKHRQYRIYLYTDAQALHHEGATIKRLGYKKKIEFYKGLFRFYLKHFIYR
ncbi:glycosyl transferase family 2 [Candidatus Magnetoovum chiemensis]|nr:glycosyl transferase family 2 [Candidatus Magnetoovum chiemensis]